MQGSCFKFLRVPAYMMQYDPLSILTPFLLKSVKKWDSAARKTKSGKGGLWEVQKLQFGPYILFYMIFYLF